ncbi:MAG: hypothetical protein J6S85_12570 [Methanobrevibacter sp.]|nr:hypothetical protein [Methanobrevibacter sp.]
MNLHNIVRKAISSVNPDQEITVKVFSGVDNTGTYAVLTYTETTAIAQVQPMNSEDIQFINNFNSSSIYKAMYIQGNWSGLNRVTENGGDLIKWNDKVWYVVSVPEGWDATAGWTKVLVVAQTDSVSEPDDDESEGGLDG